MNKDYSRAIPAEWLEMAKVFEALGHEHRQRILLTFEKHEEINIKDLVEVSSLKRTAVVHHLEILKDAKVLIGEKRGKYMFYRINPDIVIDSCERLIDYAKDLKD
jgi:ArsR family transcriptional regulator, arsenate/arsenite/antimonite-responsive transcriptional repressor